MTEEKLNEKRDFKKLLFILALSVIGTTIVSWQSLEIFTMLFTPTATKLGYGNAHYLFEKTTSCVFSYVPPILIFGLLFKNQIKLRIDIEQYTREFKKIWIIPIFAATLFVRTTTISITELVFNKELEYIPTPIQTQIDPVWYIITFFFTIIIAPICEELIYRCLLLKPLLRYGHIQAVIITSILFGFFHYDASRFLYTAIDGVIFGIIAVKANSIIPSICLHMLVNLKGLLKPIYYNLIYNNLLPNMVGVYYAFIIIGTVIFIIMAVRGYFKLDNKNPNLTSFERVRIILTNPFIIAMIVILIAITKYLSKYSN